MTSLKTLRITYCNVKDDSDEIQVNYKLRNTDITNKWVERVLNAQKLGYKIDNPARFYGFGSIAEQIAKAIEEINNTIITLNKWMQIDIRLQTVQDQDTLNQLHHIFEIKHGLLDRKNIDFAFKQALCNLNLLVHRCESIAHGAKPRHVVTYYGLPKTKVLTENDYQFFEPNIKFGTVYLNYVEIGKTLYDLMLDNDSYIDKTAFQPFFHYSADFVVKYWNEPNENLLEQCKNYFYKNLTFFQSIGYTWADLKKSIGRIPVADIDYSGDILKDLETRQFVKAVHFL